MKATINRFRFSSSDALPHNYRRLHQSTPNCFLVYVVKGWPSLEATGRFARDFVHWVFNQAFVFCQVKIAWLGRFIPAK